jgi:hypothetical protein
MQSIDINIPLNINIKHSDSNDEQIDSKYSNVFDDDDFISLPKSIKSFNISHQLNITGEFFKYIPNVKKLNILWCDHIEEESFRYLPKSVEELNIGDNSQLTDNIFPYLTGIKKLFISQGENDGWESELSPITDKAFKYLENVEILNMCNQTSITGTGFIHLKNLKEIEISGCKNNTLILENLQIYCPTAKIICRYLYGHHYGSYDEIIKF